jgi:murein DD-endopeptidase MepM/ murein hydrolase activator NlpD
MKLFLPENVWKNKRGFPFGMPVDYLMVKFHTGQDFFTDPIGTVPVYAPINGHLTTYPFSKDAGWWGHFRFEHNGDVFCLKILHMFKEMVSGDYKAGDVLGYCGATGLSVSSGASHCIGPSTEDQSSRYAVPHLHVELHKGEYKNDTNRIRSLAEQRLLDPVKYFEQWTNEINNNKKFMEFFKEKGRSTVYIKGSDGIYYPIISGKNFITLFGEWNQNTISEFDILNPKSESYFGLFKSDADGKYDAT